MNGVDIPSVKVEDQDAGLPSRIKSEPASVDASPSALSDDDIYEDTGDLDFSNIQKVYLMRLPAWLWENWSSIDEDEPIELGTVRVEDIGPDSNGEPKQKMTLLLSSSVKHNKNVPKEYNMNITNDKSTNLYVFSEKDLPGYKVKSSQRSTNGAGEADLKVPVGPSRFPGSDRHDGVKKQKWDKSRRWQPYYRKAIPKQTVLAGVVKHEINCLPIENEEYTRIMAARNAKAAKPKREIKFLSDIGANPGNLLAPGTLGSTGNFADFIRTGVPPRAKAQEQKAARIPQNELLDLIYDCFRRYNYWSLKALKAELNQPEAYLRSTLEMVAELVKTGRFAMTWTLKPENKLEQYAGVEAKEEQAPDASDGFDGPADLFNGNDDGVGTGDDEDDDEVRMEDVLPA